VRFRLARVPPPPPFPSQLDEIDAAARIVDPIISGVADGMRIFGEFLKDYVTTEW